MTRIGSVAVSHDALLELWRRRGPVAIVLLFWTAQFVALTVQRLLLRAGGDTAYLLPRVLVTLVGIGLSLIMIEGHRRLIGRSIPARLAAALALAFFCCPIHAAMNLFVFQLFVPLTSSSVIIFKAYLVALVDWFWSYAALSGLLLAFTYALELNTLQRLTHAAQIKVMRYQLNPHFMFNALNSLAALIGEKQNVSAEQMVVNLADFLRATLSLEAQDDISIEEELHLQSLYLSIERLRFGERLQVEVDVDKAALPALVPSLVTQPIVENVIHHAVANSNWPIRFRLTATREGTRLVVAAWNSPPEFVPRARSGTGVGLASIAERLYARHGANCSFAAGRGDDGSFSVRFEIPFQMARRP
ncbi:MAG TPA: histidine kinase [Allosphingosinicella sp.]|jgi:hypothetical protein